MDDAARLLEWRGRYRYVLLTIHELSPIISPVTPYLILCSAAGRHYHNRNVIPRAGFAPSEYLAIPIGDRGPFVAGVVVEFKEFL